MGSLSDEPWDELLPIQFVLDEAHEHGLFVGDEPKITHAREFRPGQIVWALAGGFFLDEFPHFEFFHDK
jgi:hypothetical protein